MIGSTRRANARLIAAMLVSAVMLGTTGCGDDSGTSEIDMPIDMLADLPDMELSDAEPDMPDACPVELCGGECITEFNTVDHCGSCDVACGLTELCEDQGEGIFACAQVARSTHRTALGLRHSCEYRTMTLEPAPSPDSTIHCWGGNDVGQITGTPSYALPPTPVRELELSEEVKDIAAGRNHTCAIVGDVDLRDDEGDVTTFVDTNRRLDCWGETTMPELVGTPMQIVSADAMTCARILVEEGGHRSQEIQCWGVDAEVGAALVEAGWTEDSGSGIFSLQKDSEMIDIAVSDDTICAVQGFVVECWGAHAPPDDEFFGADIADIDMHISHGCAQKGDLLQCWSLEDLAMETGEWAPTSPLEGVGEFAVGWRQTIRADAQPADSDAPTTVRHAGKFGPISEDAAGNTVAAGYQHVCWFNVAAHPMNRTECQGIDAAFQVTGAPIFESHAPDWATSPDLSVGGSFACNTDEGGEMLGCWGASREPQDARSDSAVGQLIRGDINMDNDDGEEQVPSPTSGVCGFAASHDEVSYIGCNESVIVETWTGTGHSWEAEEIGWPTGLVANDEGSCVLAGGAPICDGHARLMTLMAEVPLEEAFVSGVGTSETTDCVTTQGVDATGDEAVFLYCRGDLEVNGMVLATAISWPTTTIDLGVRRGGEMPRDAVCVNGEGGAVCVTQNEAGEPVILTPSTEALDELLGEEGFSVRQATAGRDFICVAVGQEVGDHVYCWGESPFLLFDGGRAGLLPLPETFAAAVDADPLLVNSGGVSMASGSGEAANTLFLQTGSSWSCLGSQEENICGDRALSEDGTPFSPGVR